MAVLSLEEIRRRNIARKNGQTNPDKEILPWTVDEIIMSAEKCWEVITLCTRKKTVETVGKNGKTYTRPSNELQYPIYHTAVVGEGATAKGKQLERNNLDTMRELYQMRNKVAKLYADENSETYMEIYHSLGEALDVYATQVVSDELQYQEGFLDKLNEARKQEAEVRSKNKGDKSDSE